jgi:hypothetical protein
VAYGDVSVCHISLEGPPEAGTKRDASLRPQVALRADPPWVDMSANHGWVSAAHGDREIEETAVAVKKAVADLQAERALP